jgi:hypothetical protein
MIATGGEVLITIFSKGSERVKKIGSYSTQSTCDMETNLVFALLLGMSK